MNITKLYFVYQDGRLHAASLILDQMAQFAIVIIAFFCADWMKNKVCEKAWDVSGVSLTQTFLQKYCDLHISPNMKELSVEDTICVN